MAARHEARGGDNEAATDGEAATGAGPREAPFVEAVGRVWRKSTALTKALAVTLVCTYTAGQLVPRLQDYLALVPDRTLPCVWNVVTAGLFPTTLTGTVVDTVSLLFIGRIVEPIWGNIEFVYFCMVVNTAVGVATFLNMYVLYVVTRSEFFLYAKFGGFHGVLAGLLVALRQLVPEDELPYVPWLRAKHLSGIYVVVTLAYCVLSGGYHHHIGLYLNVLYGTYWGWLYLRYMQVVADTGLKGDPREEFSFEAMFPEPLQPLAGRLALVFHGWFCPPPPPEPQSAGARQPFEYPLSAVRPELPPEEQQRKRTIGTRGFRVLEAHMTGRQKKGDAQGAEEGDADAPGDKGEAPPGSDGTASPDANV